MDEFEYSIQLNDRDWTEFLLAAEECALAPATLATAEEQCLSDIEQGDGRPGRDCSACVDGQLVDMTGSGPGPGTGHCAPRGVSWDGHLSLSELLSGSEDEAELGSVGRFLCRSDRPGCPSTSPMPSTQGRQPSRAPAATLASPAMRAAQSSPEQDVAQEASAAQPASEKGAASSSQAMEPPSPTPGTRTPEPGRDAAGAQPWGSPAAAQLGPPAQSGSLAPTASPKGSARKSPSSVSCSEPGLQEPLRNPSLSPAPETAPRVPGALAREEATGDKMGTEQGSPAGSPDVVRRKVPGQPRKSRKQRGASITEAAQGEKEPAGAAAQWSGTAVKTPLGSPHTPRKGKGKEKAAKPPLVKLGSEEAGDSKRLVPGPGTDEGDPAGSAVPKPKVKELGVQPPGKVKVTKQPKSGQVGSPAVRDNVLDPAELCQGSLQQPPQTQSLVAAAGAATHGGHGEPPVAETPMGLGPPHSAPEASARVDSLDVTWPEMYDYLFCDSQGEEEGTGDSGEATPMEREMSLPELYEYFFNEPEGNRKKGKGRKRKKFSSLDHTQLLKEDPAGGSLVISVPDHFFLDGTSNRTGWRRIFSVAPASEVKKAVGALKSLVQRHFTRGPAPVPLVRRGSGDNLSVIPLAPLGRGLPEGEDWEKALVLRGDPESPLALTQKDMCLVFCAFASWAVKTSDLQAPDAWKTMFLASFGTLSAIRYFRRQVREGHPRT
ncbi:PERM1 protein, partial [Rhinopomastus cyanomelas]|nr:PERM1 protein [Rhinopomastus cyanomelas]